MTPTAEQRIRAAVAELGDALVAAVSEATPADAPVRLVTIPEVAELLGGISRPTIYSLIGAGQLRSVKVGRRRLVPMSSIAELTEGTKKAGPVVSPGRPMEDDRDRGQPRPAA